MFKIRTYNKISASGLGLFPAADYTVAENQCDADAILLRSYNLHDQVLDPGVLAVARAGAGVNNIPVSHYTDQGIVVFNTPGANANAVKELVIASLLLSSRGILPGRDFVKQLGHIDNTDELSKLLESEKKRFAGNELYGKKLGLVGLGAIGSMVADVALALGMQVFGYDPALSIEAAWKLSARVERMESLETLLAKVDYLSLHVPAIPATEKMINTETLKCLAADAVVLNFARSAIVDPEAIVSALDQQQLRQYYCDFPEPCLIGHEKVVALPHIGASTAEAEENCSIMAVNQLRDFLENGNIQNSVNFPATRMQRGEASCRISFTNKNVPGVLGELLGILAAGEINVIDMVNKSRDDIAYNILDLAEHPNKDIITRIKAVEHIINLRLI